MFMLTVVKFLRTKNWFDEDARRKCGIWFSMLFNLIDFNDNECLQCINLVDSTPKDPEFDWIKSVYFVHNCLLVALL